MKYLFPLSIVLISFQLHAQNEVKPEAQHVIEYDFETKDPPSVPPAKHGQNSVYRIININKFIYEVKIESSQSDYYSEKPDIFDLLKYEQQNENSIGKEIGEAGDPDTNTGEQQSLENLGSEKAFLENNQMQFNLLTQKMSALKAGPQSSESDIIQQELQTRIENLEQVIEEQNNTISDLRSIIQDEYLTRTGELFSYAFQVDLMHMKLEEAKTLKNKLVRLTVTDNLTFEEAEYGLKIILEDYPLADNPNKMLSRFKESIRRYKTDESLYRIDPVVLKHFNDDPGKVFNSIKNLSEEIEETKKKVDDSNYPKIITDINDLYSKLKNENNYVAVSSPVQAKRDIINYKVTIQPRKDIKSLDAMGKREFDTTVPIHGGVKIDFSTGLTISSGLNNKTYNTSISPIDSTKTIITENNNNNIGTLSIAGLMHISPRTSNRAKLAGTFGLGLNAADLNAAQVYVGGSGIFGVENRFILTIGATMAQVDYLKSEYELNEPISTELVNPEDLTEKVNRVGFFIGFSYNLTNKKKE